MYLRNFIKNYGEKIVIVILVFLLIISHRTIKEKEKIEDKYNQEYYIKYRYGVAHKSTIDYLKFLNKSFKNGKVDISDDEKRLEYERYSRYEESYNLYYELSVLLNAYDIYDYKPYEELKDKYYYREPNDIIEFFNLIQRKFPFADYKLNENIKEIPIKTSSIDYLNSIYATQKLDEIIKTIEEFNRKHEEDYRYLDRNNGKGFLENGYILKLLYKLNGVVMETQRELDFGEGVKLGLRNIEKYNNVIPFKMYSNIDIHWQFHESEYSKCYYVLDTKNGIVLGLLAKDDYEELKIISIEQKENIINILIEEEKDKVPNKKYPIDQDMTKVLEENQIEDLSEEAKHVALGNKLIYVQNVIKGLKPGEVKNLKFNVLNTKGEKYPELHLNEIETNINN